MSASENEPSQMPWKYAEYLDPQHSECILSKDLVAPNGFMTWSFYGGSLSPSDRTLESLIYFFAMNPDHIRPMMPTLGDIDAELVQKLKDNQSGCLVGRKLLERTKRSVGDRFALTGVSHKGIDLDFEVIGYLPDGRFSQSAIMNVAHLRHGFETYERVTGKIHPSSDRSLNTIYLKVPDLKAFERIRDQVEGSPLFSAVPVRCETEKQVIARVKE